MNGLQGTVIGIDDDGPTVNFSTLNRSMKLEKYTFTLFSKAHNKDIACRKQIPLHLAFALTVHKSQGMTLDRVVIDCRNMHTPGQIGVAVGRVTNKKGLQIVNFQKSYLRTHPKCVNDLYKEDACIAITDLSCCALDIMQYEYTEEEFNQDEPGAKGSSIVVSPEEDLGTEDIPDECELMTALDSEEVMSDPKYVSPDLSAVQSILNALMHDDPETEEQRKENIICKYLLQEEKRAHFFVQELSNVICKTLEGLRKDSISLSDIKTFYTALHEYMSGDKYQNLLMNVFEKTPEREHSNIGFKVMKSLRVKYLEQEVQPIVQRDEEKASASKSKKYTLSDAGRGTIRYIGGWCVATLKYSKKKTIARNLYNRAKVQLVKEKDSEVKLLESLGSNIADLLLTSSDIASLDITKEKQYRSGGLMNISDQAYEFFRTLDERLRSLETNEIVQQHGTDFYRFVQDKICDDSELFADWKNLFIFIDPEIHVAEGEHELDAGLSTLQSKSPNLCELLRGESSTTFARLSTCDTSSSKEDVSTHDDIIRVVYKEVCQKFVRMSSAQFRRTYIRQLKAEKQEAHRKQIRMRSAKKSSSKFDFDSILSDKSVEKIASHRRLQAELEADIDYFKKSKSFNKKQLLTLCEAYQVKSTKSATNAKLAEALTSVVINTESIPNPQFVMTGEQEVTTEEGLAQDFTSSIEKGKRASKSRDKGKRLAKKKKAAVVEYPCGVCSQECCESAIACDMCDTWYHYECVNLDEASVEILKNRDWFCDLCDS